jgi:hypothetical protein
MGSTKLNYFHVSSMTMQSSEYRDVLGIICCKIEKCNEFMNFCLVCKLWRDVGNSVKIKFANKFMQKVSNEYSWTNATQTTTVVRVIEYHYLPTKLQCLHGPWTEKITSVDSSGNQKTREIQKYRHNLGTIVEMSSDEELRGWMINYDPIIYGNSSASIF